MNTHGDIAIETLSAPHQERALALWLQHAAGRILFEDVRAYALERIDPALSAETRAVIQKGIDDAMYGLMMVIDGVSGSLSNDSQSVQLSVIARLVNHRPPGIAAELDLSERRRHVHGLSQLA